MSILLASVSRSFMDVIKDVGQTLHFFKKLKVAPVYFIISVICTTASVFFNCIGLALLFPLVRGLIQGDFTKVADHYGISDLLTSQFPVLFSTSKSFFLLILGLILFSVCMNNILSYISALTIGHQIRIADHNMRKLMIDRLLSFGIKYYDEVNVSRISDIILKGPTAISGQIRPFMMLFSQVLSLIAYTCILFGISWRLTCVVLLLLPIRQFLVSRLADHIKHLSHVKEDASTAMRHLTLNLAHCITIVKSYAAEKAEQKRLEDASKEDVQASYEMQKKRLLIKPIQDFTSLITILIVVLAMSFLSDDFGTKNVTLYLVFFFVLRKSMPCFSALMNFQLSFSSKVALIDRVKEVLNDEGKYYVPSGNTVLKEFRNNIEFKNLTFGYSEDSPVIHDLSFTIQKGQTVALVGATGAGKSTIAHLIKRFYDCPEKSIFIDGIDIREYTTESLMENTAIVTQRPMLFNGTIRENITYGATLEVTDEEVFVALKKAQLEKFISDLPEGLDTEISYRGNKLSGGEIQRLMIARTFIKKSEIVILDEATSSLDVKTEKMVMEAISAATRGRTNIIIAHRLSTIVHADLVVVIDKGCLIEQGSLEELLNKKGLFYEYWNTQRVTKHAEHGIVAGSIE